jgi:hypothetical protein
MHSYYVVPSLHVSDLHLEIWFVVIFKSWSISRSCSIYTDETLKGLEVDGAWNFKCGSITGEREQGSFNMFNLS